MNATQKGKTMDESCSLGMFLYLRLTSTTPIAQDDNGPCPEDLEPGECIRCGQCCEE